MYRSDGHRLTLSGLRETRQVAGLTAFLYAATAHKRQPVSGRRSLHASSSQSSSLSRSDREPGTSSRARQSPGLDDSGANREHKEEASEGASPASPVASPAAAAASPSRYSPRLAAETGNVSRGKVGFQETGREIETEERTPSSSGERPGASSNREFPSSLPPSSEPARLTHAAEVPQERHCEGSLASVYLDDATAEVVVAVLEELRAFPRLQRLDLYLWGLDWTPEMIALLGDVFDASASTLESVSLRCRVPAPVLTAMLERLPGNVRYLDVSENMLGGDLTAVPVLERILRRNGIESLKVNQVGWSREAKETFAKAIEGLGVFNCLQWIEGIDLSECLAIPPQVFMQASVPAPPCSSVAATTTPLAHLYGHRPGASGVAGARRTAAEVLAKSLPATTVNYTLLRYLRIRTFLPMLVGSRVRVWWKPTRETQRTDFSGRYWPARVVHGCPDTLVCKLVYDNNEQDFISLRFLQPHHPFRYGGGWGSVVTPSPLPSSSRLSASSGEPPSGPRLVSVATPDPRQARLDRVEREARSARARSVSASPSEGLGLASAGDSLFVAPQDATHAPQTAAFGGSGASPVVSPRRGQRQRTRGDRAGGAGSDGEETDEGGDFSEAETGTAVRGKRSREARRPRGRRRGRAATGKSSSRFRQDPREAEEREETGDVSGRENDRRQIAETRRLGPCGRGATPLRNGVVGAGPETGGSEALEGEEAKMRKRCRNSDGRFLKEEKRDEPRDAGPRTAASRRSRKSSRRGSSSSFEASESTSRLRPPSSFPRSAGPETQSPFAAGRRVSPRLQLLSASGKGERETEATAGRRGARGRGGASLARLRSGSRETELVQTPRRPARRARSESERGAPGRRRSTGEETGPGLQIEGEAKDKKAQAGEPSGGAGRRRRRGARANGEAEGRTGVEDEGGESIRPSGAGSGDAGTPHPWQDAGRPAGEGGSVRVGRIRAAKRRMRKEASPAVPPSSRGTRGSRRSDAPSCGAEEKPEKSQEENGEQLDAAGASDETAVRRERGDVASCAAPRAPNEQRRNNEGATPERPRDICCGPFPLSRDEIRTAATFYPYLFEQRLHTYLLAPPKETDGVETRESRDAREESASLEGSADPRARATGREPPASTAPRTGRKTQTQPGADETEEGRRAMGGHDSEREARSRGALECGGILKSEEGGVRVGEMPLEVVGNVLLPGELCEFRDEEEHRGSDPSDFVGMVVSVNSEEPLYVVRCVYHDDDTLLQINSSDIRRAVIVPLDAWIAWRFAYERYIQREKAKKSPSSEEVDGQRSLRPLVKTERRRRRGESSSGLNGDAGNTARRRAREGFAGGALGAGEKEPKRDEGTAFASFRDVPPFATFYMLPLATTARLNQMTASGPPAVTQRNPVDLKLLPAEDFAEEFAVRQAAFARQRLGQGREVADLSLLTGTRGEPPEAPQRRWAPSAGRDAAETRGSEHDAEGEGGGQIAPLSQADVKAGESGGGPGKTRDGGDVVGHACHADASRWFAKTDMCVDPSALAVSRPTGARGGQGDWPFLMGTRSKALAPLLSLLSVVSSHLASPFLKHVVHPRIQQIDRRCWLALLPKSELLQRVVDLSKEVATLKTQVQRDVALSSECQRLRVALEKQKEREGELEGLLKCIICVSRTRSVALAPCLHFYFCQPCSQGLAQCPICRGKILSRVEVKREQGGDEESDQESG
ncbi:conserved hypothetical protein [Neospora caninum Liverpool]|nr:conserved hypothetical protein [Neospora caninum Liverpool]CBZ55674.1 conserved hypothetical protein [Neospora caninum Liverpool]|eukprot:XP_003885700.1 conserved hypothetical protein [Neospora caninum Liverpool]